jgi:hypothetical protein
VLVVLLFGILFAMAQGRGAFILFEGRLPSFSCQYSSEIVIGIDRCGKSTQVKLLTDGLNALGQTSEAIRFPNRESNIGQLINAYLSSTSNLNDQTIHLLFSANRWEQSTDIEAKLRSGVNLVSYFTVFNDENPIYRFVIAMRIVVWPSPLPKE